MVYLICMAHPEYPETEVSSIVYSKRYSLKQLEYSEIRAALEASYPGKTVYSPLDHCDKGLVHSVYLSGNKEGQGRIITNFQMWSVK